MTQDDLQQVQQMISQSRQQAGYGTSLVPFHIHNGFDSPHLSYTYILSHVLYGATAATAANYSVFFAAPTTMSVVGVSEFHTTAGTDGSAVTLNLEKLSGATAPGGGLAILSTALNLRGTANTIQTGVLQVPAINLRMVKGDRLALKLSGVPTSLANMQVTITFSALLQ